MSPQRHLDDVARRWAEMLARPLEQLDDAWLDTLVRAGGGDALPEAPWGDRLALAAFDVFCGPQPAPDDFDELPARWCLLPRADRLGRLAAVALAGNPGAVRACVRRGPRQALEQALGPAYERLASLGAGAAAAPPALAERAPSAWALDGYVLLLKAGRWRQPALRRWVRLGLPGIPLNTALTKPSRAEADAAAQRLLDIDAWFTH